MRATPIAMQFVTWLVVGWLAFNAQASVDNAVQAAHKLPVIESRLTDQGRRIDRLESLDGKIDRLAENLAGVMAELRASK